MVTVICLITLLLYTTDDSCIYNQLFYLVFLMYDTAEQCDLGFTKMDDAVSTTFQRNCLNDLYHYPQEQSQIRPRNFW